MIEFVTPESIGKDLNDENWANGDELVAVSLANTWLNSYKFVAFDIDDIPKPLKLAGALVAQAYINGDMFAGKVEPSVKVKTVKADTVEVSTTYATEQTLVSANELRALQLIQPFIKRSKVTQIPVIRR